MEFTADQIAQLEANLDGEKVKERSGFSYIEGWWAVREANRIFGHDNWQHEIVDLTPAIKTSQGIFNYKNREGREGYLIAYTATVRVTVGEQIHDGVGYGEGIDYSNCGQAYESAVKEAETDAMKRALKNWGNPFGLALYDKDQVSVDRAPSDKGYGFCTIEGHDNAAFSRSEKQANAGFPPSHKIGNTNQWCEKPADAAPEPAVERERPAWDTDAYREANEALSVLFANPDDKANYVSGLIGRRMAHPKDVTDEEWNKVFEAASNDVQALESAPPGDPASEPVEAVK